MTSALGGLAPAVSARRTVEHAHPWVLIAGFFSVAERCVDMVAITAAVYCAYGIYQMSGLGSRIDYPASEVLLAGAGFALLFIILLERRGGYRPYVSLLGVRDTERVLRVTLESFLIALLVAYLTTERVPRLVVLLAMVTVPAFVTVSKLEMYSAICHLRSKAYGKRNAVILGAGQLGRRAYSLLVRSPKCGIDPVVFVDDDPERQGLEIYESAYQRKRATKVIPGPLSAQLLRQFDAHVLVVAATGTDRESIARLASAAGVDAYWVCEDVSEPGLWIDYVKLDGIMLEHLSTGRTRIAGDTAKRIIDIVASTLLLAVLAVPFALIAALVKMTSPGPVFFRQERVGKGGSLFHIYKFRTMYRDAPQYSQSPGAGEDPRITPLGRLLRRTSLDELPQLLNVLAGDMSLVGPRPEMPFIVEQYTPLQRRRLAVKPGMTGLWQLSADRAFPIHENLEYDLYYVRNRSLFMDVAILLHTPLFAGRGV